MRVPLPSRILCALIALSGPLGLNDATAQTLSSRPALRTALPWTVSPTRPIPSAHRLPRGAPRALIHAPAHLDADAPIQLVIFLHGWSGCARVLGLSGETSCVRDGPPRAGWGLAETHDLAQTNTIFIIPQLAWLRRNGSAGRFRQSGFARTWLEHLVREHIAPRLGTPTAVSLESYAPITLLAHSAGYETALAWLEEGELGSLIDSVILFDALYANEEAFWQWVRLDPNSRRLVSIHGRSGTPRRHTRRLRRLAGLEPDGSPGPPLTSLEAHPIQTMVTTASHGTMPQVHIIEVLQALASWRR